MELWIRSQTKNKLIRTNELYVDIPKDFGIDGFGVYCVSALENYGFIKLGTYKTIERVLEVFDEIQNKIAYNESLRALAPRIRDVKGHEEDIGKLFKDIIYEMPKE